MFSLKEDINLIPKALGLRKIRATQKLLGKYWDFLNLNQLEKNLLLKRNSKTNLTFYFL